MYIFYRISNNSYNKVKPPYVTKLNCLKNFLNKFSEDIHILCDNLTDSDLKDFINSNPRLHPSFTNLGNAPSFRYCLSKAIELDDEEIVYFVEDDYIHKTNSETVLNEGINLGADFITLYDHPDKYVDGINPYVDGGGEETKVFLTNSCHWKFTNSTTMTFASKVKTLKEVYNIITPFVTGIHPGDFNMFIKLREFGKSLISPIPGYCTHGETVALSPLTDWQKEI